MRQFFKFQYPNRKSLILLQYNNILSKYTFLQSDINNLHTVDQLSHLIQTPFISQIKKYRSNLLQISNFDIKFFDLNNLHYNKESIDQSPSHDKIAWLENGQIIKKLALSNELMAQQIFQKINEDNLSHYLQIISTFNCLSIRLWQKIFSIVSCKYRDKSLQTRNIWSIACQQYSSKFYFKKGSNSLFKFMYPQVYLNDVTTLSDFLKKTQYYQDYIVKNDNYQKTQTKLQILSTRINFIFKVGKAGNLNIYFIKEKFKKRVDQMIQIAKDYNDSILHKNLLIALYHFYAYINHDDLEFFKQIQKYVIEYLDQLFKAKSNKDIGEVKSEIFEDTSQQSISKLVVRILSIWKLNQFPNAQIYQKFIKPFLNQSYQKNQNVQFYPRIASNLLGSGIEQMDLIKKLLDKGIQGNTHKEGNEEHILKHYLNIYLKQNRYQTGSDCSKHQNQALIKHFQKNCNPQQIRSSCLKNSIIASQNYKYKKNYEIQHAEQIWVKILDIVFKGYKTHKNQNFCVFQIDYMAFVDQHTLIFEIIGGHYTKKTLNEAVNYQDIKTTGKKRVRQSILKHYGANIIQIHCQEPSFSMIQQTKNIEMGKKLLVQKIRKFIPKFEIKPNNDYYQSNRRLKDLKFQVPEI